MIDIHTHILPGIDDGARDFVGSVATVRWLVNQGVTDIIATPHYVDETNFVSERARNQELLEELKVLLEEEKVRVNLFLGNELYISRNLRDLLEKRRIASLADSKYVLVELPLNEEFPNYIDYFLDLMEGGYKIILAHPERYVIIQDNYDIAKELHKMGILFQSNLRSLDGKYGMGAKKIVKKLAKDKMIFTFASDTHHASRNFSLLAAQKKLLKYYNEREIAHLLRINPGRILGR